MDGDGAPEIELRQGRLHIAREVHEGALFSCASLALLERDGQWWLLPLRAGAGGLQVKLRNARGDRVVESQEFFRGLGLPDDPAPRRLRLLPGAGEGLLRLVPVC